RAAPGGSVEPGAGGESGWVAVQRGGEVVGRAGPLEADAPVWAAALFGLEVRLAVTTRAPVVYRPLPVQPGVEQDVALVLPPGVSAVQVAEVLRRAVGGRRRQGGSRRARPSIGPGTGEQDAAAARGGGAPARARSAVAADVPRGAGA